MSWNSRKGARGLHGVSRRVFPAEVTREYLDGNARQAERVFGWNRISWDTKAKVLIGPFSRRGRARGKSAVRAADHDMKPLAKLVPVGILEVYFPPYHRQYNPIERCWSALERHGNGSWLNSVSTALNWAECADQTSTAGSRLTRSLTCCRTHVPEPRGSPRLGLRALRRVLLPLHAKRGS
jgi:transposase